MHVVRARFLQRPACTAQKLGEHDIIRIDGDDMGRGGRSMRERDVQGPGLGTLRTGPVKELDPLGMGRAEFLDGGPQRRICRVVVHHDDLVALNGPILPQQGLKGADHHMRRFRTGRDVNRKLRGFRIPPICHQPCGQTGDGRPKTDKGKLDSDNGHGRGPCRP